MRHKTKVSVYKFEFSCKGFDEFLFPNFPCLVVLEISLENADFQIIHRVSGTAKMLSDWFKCIPLPDVRSMTIHSLPECLLCFTHISNVRTFLANY